MLTLDQILQHIKGQKPKAAAALAAAKALQSEIDKHITGTTFKDSFNRIKSLQGETDFNIMKEIASPQTPPLFQKFRSQYSKIFRADGFIFKYDFDGEHEALKDKAEEILSDVWKGRSLFTFMKECWEKMNDERPNDIIVIELPAAESIDPNPYIRIVPLENIFDIHQYGNTIGWYIEFEDKPKPNGEAKDKLRVYRYRDAEKDVIVIKDGDNFYFQTDQNNEPDVIINRIPWTPAIRPGQIPFHFQEQGCVVNQYFFGLTLADKYQMRCNDHDLTVKKHAWPLFYSYPVVCGTCNGKRQVYQEPEQRDPQGHLEDGGDQYNREDFWKTCKSCKGQGVVDFAPSNSDKGISIPLPVDAGKDVVIPNIPTPAGYVERDVEVIRLQKETKQDAKEEIEESVMGVVGLIDRVSNITATKTLLDYQPVEDRMWAHSERGENVHRFLADTILALAFNTTQVTSNPNGTINYVQRFKESVIHYGRKYILKSENEYDVEFKLAKESGMPDTMLLEILKGKIYSKYQNDDAEKTRQLFLLEVMPYPTYTVTELKNIGIASNEDLGVKMSFNDIVELFEESEGPMELYYGKRKDVREKFYDIYLEMNPAQEEPVNPPAIPAVINNANPKEDEQV